MKSYSQVNGQIRKAMCFYPDKGVPMACVEAFVVVHGKEILAFGKVGGRVDAMNGGMDEMPKFPSRGNNPIVFSALRRTVVPRQVKTGVPKWRIDSSFMVSTSMFYRYWDAADRMIALGDTSQREADNETDSDQA